MPPTRQTIYNRRNDARRLQEIAGAMLEITREDTGDTHGFLIYTREGEPLFKAHRYEVAAAFVSGYLAATDDASNPPEEHPMAHIDEAITAQIAGHIARGLAPDLPQRLTVDDTEYIAITSAYLARRIVEALQMTQDALGAAASALHDARRPSL